MNSMRGLVPWLQPYAELLIGWAAQQGYSPRVTSIYRSRALQTKLYLRWLSGGSPYPAAPPGRSMHEYGRAFDIVTARPEDLTTLGLIWEAWGGTWGGRSKTWPDPIHFEA